MRRLCLLLIPAALLAGPARYARLGDFEGKVEVQCQPADPWMSALRNLPLPESTWVRTGPSSRAEIEFEEGNALRLGPDTQIELSDLSRLSTGQRVTLISLERGLAYFTGQAEGRDALSLAVPGAQVTVRRGTRLRLETSDSFSQAAVIEGSVRFSSPAAEFDLTESQTARVEPAHTARFFLYREVTPHDLDSWSERRDKALVTPASGRHVPVAYGAADLDSAGEWVETSDLGSVWKPKVAEDWAPFREGRWLWFDTLGYTWVAGEAWGWLPYHYGRWARREQLGWVWAPAKRAVFKPGDVYWLRGGKIAGWGPLAPGEEWTPSAPPQLFLNLLTTWADFTADARAIDPTGFTARPKEALGAAAFALALPSPAFIAARLEAARPPLRAGGARVVPIVPGGSYPSNDGVITAAPTSGDTAPVAVVTNPTAPEPPVVVIQSGPPTPPAPPQDVLYPVPVYTGIVVVNPPERYEGGRRRSGSNPIAAAPSKPAAVTPPTPAPVSAISHSADDTRGRTSRPPTAATPPGSKPPEPPASGGTRYQPPPAVKPPDPKPAPAPGTRYQTPAPAKAEDKSEPAKHAEDRPATKRQQ